jgi:uncharacterized protein YgbK (DUF1537 family)
VSETTVGLTPTRPVLPASEQTRNEARLLHPYPDSRVVDAADLAKIATDSGTVLVVIDDDPTGSQSVSDIPVLTAWHVPDLEWALSQNTLVVFVLTNSRSVDAATAAARNTEVVLNATTAARNLGKTLTFLSRGDSLLRGHFPDETDAIQNAVLSAGGRSIDGVIFVPAFPSAGRVTVGGIHYLRSGEDLVPVAQTEFARDSSFGFTHSDLREYVQEKTSYRVQSASVVVVGLAHIRTSAEQIVADLSDISNGQFVVADCVTDDDLRALCEGLALAESRGKVFLYRTGPAFVGARVGQIQPEPLDVTEALIGSEKREVGGLVVIGSHVELTNRQLHQLQAGRPNIGDIEMDVDRLEAVGGAAYLGELAHAVVVALGEDDVILRTTRSVRTGVNAGESLRISRNISSAVSSVVHAVASQCRPRFVVAKGGITSNDVATDGLEIRRGTIRGPLLKGLVSLWCPVGGLAQGIPYVVFPGNVGDDSALLAIVDKLSLSGANSATQKRTLK